MIVTSCHPSVQYPCCWAKPLPLLRVLSCTSCSTAVQSSEVALMLFLTRARSFPGRLGEDVANFTSWMMQVFTFASWCFQPALPCTRTGELWKPMWKPTVDSSRLLLQCKQTTRVLSCFRKHCREIKPPGLLCCACGFFKKPSGVLSSHVRLNPEDQKLRSFLWAVDWESKWHSSDAEQLKSVLSRVHFGLTAPFACVLLKYFE